MNEVFKSQLISRADIPIRFIIVRILALFFTFILVLYKIPYELIVLYLIVVIAFILSPITAIVEVYPDYFKLIRNGLLYKNFKREEEYTYKDVKEFEFNKSKFNLWIGIISFLLPFRGGGSYCYTLPSIIFQHKEGEETYEITKKFDYSTKDLTKSLEIIEKIVKEHGHK
jgi:hypothetical protein